MHKHERSSINIPIKVRGNNSISMPSIIIGYAMIFCLHFEVIIKWTCIVNTCNISGFRNIVMINTFHICTTNMINIPSSNIGFILLVTFIVYYMRFVHVFLLVLCFVNTSRASYSRNMVKEMKLADWSEVTWSSLWCHNGWICYLRKHCDVISNNYVQS